LFCQLELKLEVFFFKEKLEVVWLNILINFDFYIPSHELMDIFELKSRFFF